MLSLIRYVSVKDLAARPLRVVTFVIAIALGIALVVAMHVATDTVVRNFNTQIDKTAGVADLQITFGTGESGFPEEVLDTVQAQAYVERAIAVVRGELTFASGAGGSVELFGVDVLDEDVTRLYSVNMSARTPDDFTIINDPHGVFLTEKLAARRNVKVGDRLELASIDGVHAYTVHGIFAGEGLADAYDGDLAVMNLPAAQGVLGLWTRDEVSNVHQIDVTLRDGVANSDAIGALRGILPPALSITEPEQRQLANRRLVGGLRATLLGISVFALVAAMFIVYSTTAALVTYRTPVLGTLVVAGASPAALSKLVLMEAAVLGLFGGTLGTALGLAMARFAVHDAAVGLSLNYSMNFVPLGSVLGWRPELLMFPLLGGGVAVVSAGYPTMRLRRLDPLALQRIEHRDQRSVPWIFAAAAAVCGAVGSVALTKGASLGSAGLCSTGSTLICLAALLLALPLARTAWRVLRAPVRWIFRTAGWVAIEHLNRNVERSLVTMAAIALSIGVVLAASTLPRSFRESVSHWYGFYGDVVVSSRARQGGWLKAPTSGDYEQVIAAMPSVRRVETFRVLQGQEYRGDRIAIASLSDGYVERALEKAEIANDDRAAAIAAIRRGEAAAVSENMAAHYRLRIGETLELDPPTEHLSLRIAAIVPDFVSDRGSVLLSRNLVREKWRDSLVNYFAVLLDGETTAPAFRTAFTESAGSLAAGLTVTSVSGLVSQIDDAIAAAFADIDALQLLVVVITIAGIVDLVVSNVLDRRRVHAVLRIAGTSDRGVLRVIACEGGILGVTAGFVGVAIGILASWVWIEFTYPILVGYVLRLHFAWTNAILCVVLATATAVAAGGVAGWLRMRESPIDAVRAE